MTALSPGNCLGPRSQPQAGRVCSSGGVPSSRPSFLSVVARGRTDAAAPILAPARFPGEAGGGRWWNGKREERAGREGKEKEEQRLGVGGGEKEPRAGEPEEQQQEEVGARG